MRHPIWIVLWLALFAFFFIAFLTETSSVVIWTTAGVLIFALCALLVVVDVRDRLAIQRDIKAGRPQAVLDRQWEPGDDVKESLFPSCVPRRRPFALR